MLQGKGMSAAINMRLAKQTIETLKRVLDDSVPQKKKCSPKVWQPFYLLNLHLETPQLNIHQLRGAEYILKL